MTYLSLSMTLSDFWSNLELFSVC